MTKNNCHILCGLMILVLMTITSKSFGQTSSSLTQPKAKNIKVDDELRAQFDFEATTLEGKAKAPPGLTLQGRVHQEKSQMVKLRSQFRSKIDKSAYIVETVNP